MHQRQQGVDLDRKPAVGRGDHENVGDPCEFGNQAGLVLRSRDVLDDGIRVAHVEGAVVERKLATVGLDVRHRGKGGAKAIARAKSDGGDVCRIRPEALEGIRTGPDAIGTAGTVVDADVHDPRVGIDVRPDERHAAATRPPGDGFGKTAERHRR